MESVYQCCGRSGHIGKENNKSNTSFPTLIGGFHVMIFGPFHFVFRCVLNLGRNFVHGDVYPIMYKTLTKTIIVCLEHVFFLKSSWRRLSGECGSPSNPADAGAWSVTARSMWIGGRRPHERCTSRALETGESSRRLGHFSNMRSPSGKIAWAFFSEAMAGNVPKF